MCNFDHIVEFIHFLSNVIDVVCTSGTWLNDFTDDQVCMVSGKSYNIPPPRYIKHFSTDLG